MQQVLYNEFNKTNVANGGKQMKHYDVQEAFDMLKQNKITSNEESVRRWLRQGVIKGIPPVTRKEGWLIREDDLLTFIRSRLPDTPTIDTTSNTDDEKETDRESIRDRMWWELAHKHLFEGFIEPKRKQIKECAEHQKYSKALEKDAWDLISQHKMGYANPHIPYLLDAFLFDGKRIRMDDRYELLEERILYALLEHIRKEKASKN